MTGQDLRNWLEINYLNEKENTYSALANLLNMTPQAFQSKLRAKRSVDNEFVIDIAKALNISPAEIGLIVSYVSDNDDTKNAALLELEELKNLYISCSKENMQLKNEVAALRSQLEKQKVETQSK